MIQTDILAVLLADPIVSSLVGTRIHPLRLPQRGILPAAVYQRITVNPVNSLDGDSFLDNVRIQFTSWASTYEDATYLANAIRQALVLSGLFKIVTNLEIDTEDKETKSYGVITDFSVWAELELLVPPEFDYLLLETSDSILLETGDLLALEV